MCLAQGPQRSDAGEARTRGPSVSSQALYNWATALPPTKCPAWSGSKLFDTLMVLKESSIQGVKYGTLIKCEGIIVLENPKADQNTLFHKYVILNNLDCTFSHDLYL